MGRKRKQNGDEQPGAGDKQGAERKQCDEKSQADNKTPKRKSGRRKEPSPPPATAHEDDAEGTAGDTAGDAAPDAAEGAPTDSRDLYAVLGVPRDASPASIRKAYHRMALRLHPDKNPGDETAKDRFQALQRVFGILGDSEKRRFYDETGCTGEGDESGLSADTVTDLYTYFRTIFTKITPADISAFERTYRGSEEEAADLKKLFTRFNGT